MFEVLQSKFYNLKAALKIYAIPNNLSDMKALLDTFNQGKALEGTLIVVVKASRRFVSSSTYAM